jgi:rhomboid protease GluP
VHYGAKVNSLLIAGEWWRLFSAMFIHIGPLHLVMNMLSLYILGTVVERMYGKIRYLWIYFIAGLVGSVMSAIFVPSISAGASGAIYGLAGGLFYFGMVFPSIFLRKIGRSMIYILVLNIAITFIVPGVDIAGHIGGFLGGFLAAGSVHFAKKKKLLLQIPMLLGTFVFTLGSIWFLQQNPFPKNVEPSVLIAAQLNLEDGKIDQAYQLLQNPVFLDQNISASYLFMLGYIEANYGRFDVAENYFQQVIEKDPSIDGAYFNLANLEKRKGNIQEAKNYIDEAIRLSPTDVNYKKLQKELEDLSNAD